MNNKEIKDCAHCEHGKISVFEHPCNVCINNRNHEYFLPKFERSRKLSSDILTTNLFEDTKKMMQAITEASEKKIFEERKESGDIKEDFALILNPKHKDIIPELWYKAGLVIPIVWSPLAEEEKCYVVTDKTFVKNARVNIHSMLGLPGWLPQYEGEWVTDEKEDKG
ncbi:MAG: hypothetical protein J6Y02_01270 [Pseudobutyrivibrio sp.]|nr:hypothetical protein [Pseudobutyrivibrio sp.]